MKCETRKLFEGLYARKDTRIDTGKRKDESLNSSIGSVGKFWRWFVGKKSALDGTECAGGAIKG
ncbi:hypothetical protein AVEN_177669-1, partial [Araneus ventricosus]